MAATQSQQRTGLGTERGGAALACLGFAVTLGLVVGVYGAVQTGLSQRYLHWGMYGLLAQALQASAVRAIGVALLYGVVFVVGGWLRRKSRALAWILAPAITVVLAIGGAWFLIPIVHSGPPPEIGGPQILIAILAVGLFWLALTGVVWSKLSGLLHRAWVILGALSLLLVLVPSLLLVARRSADGPNVVVVGVDTLRADHLGVYGYERDTSPNIDAWSQRATVFDNCIAAIPRTTQSLASIFTGKYPHRIGVRYLSDPLPDRELSLPEIMKNAGYRTIAVVATGIPYKKLDQGFDVVIDTKQEFSAEETVDRVIAALAETSGKYFLFVFFRDPHMPYQAPELVFDLEYQGESREKLTYRGNKAEMVFKNSLDERLREHAIALYDSEVHYMDREFGRLMTAVEAKSANNLVLFFSDHGESLGEHDFYYDHGDLLYQPSLRIPCLIEGLALGERRVGEVVRGVDLTPSLLGALGLELRRNEFDGVDLAAEHPPLEAYSETGRALLKTAFETGRRHMKGLEGRLRSLVYGRTKLIYVPKGDGAFEFELYDLDGDPLELDDLEGEVEADRLKQRLLGWVRDDEPNWAKPEEDLTEEEAKRLRRLGYL